MSVQTLTTPKERHDTTDHLGNEYPVIKELYKNTNHWGWVEDLFLGGNDDGIAMRLFHGYPYEPESRKLWKSLCAGAEAVIDVGAHTGIYSLEAWKAGAKQVFSIEPYYLNFARLLMNLRHAGFATDCTVYCAAGDKNAFALLRVMGGNHYCSAGGVVFDDKLQDKIDRNLIHVDGGMEYSIIVNRLDSLLRKHLHKKIAVVKIDTEQHGAAVLRGMPQILSQKPDLLLECIEPGLGKILKPLGYHFYKVNEKTGLEPVADLIPDDPFTFDSPNRFASVRSF